MTRMKAVALTGETKTTTQKYFFVKKTFFLYITTTSLNLNDNFCFNKSHAFFPHATFRINFPCKISIYAKKYEPC